MENSTTIDKPSDILKHINLPAGAVASLKGPFVLSASILPGRNGLATLFRVTGISLETDEIIAESTVDPANIQRFPYERESLDDDGTVNTLWATGHDAFRFAADSGLRMATV